jgi:hypothetical protein
MQEWHTLLKKNRSVQSSWIICNFVSAVFAKRKLSLAAQLTCDGFYFMLYVEDSNGRTNASSAAKSSAFDSLVKQQLV